MVPIKVFVMIMAISVVPTIGAQERTGLVPEVQTAEVPFYPPIALAARVSGSVSFRVTTDGTRALNLELLSGPAMLSKAAEVNIRSWQFVKHEPTSFVTTFHYVIIEGSNCKTGNQPIVLRLPTEIEVNTSLQGCDEARYFRMQKYLNERHVYPVELHVSRDEKESASPPEVVFFASGRNVTSTLEDGVYLVPEDFASRGTLGIRTIIGKESMGITGIGAGSLKCIWHLELPSSLELTAKELVSGGDKRRSCVLSFDPLDGDGMVMRVSPCRRPVRR